MGSQTAGVLTVPLGDKPPKYQTTGLAICSCLVPGIATLLCLLCLARPSRCTLPESEGAKALHVSLKSRLRWFVPGLPPAIRVVKVTLDAEVVLKRNKLLTRSLSSVMIPCMKIQAHKQQGAKGIGCPWPPGASAHNYSVNCWSLQLMLLVLL